jgi:hypothetical protein
MPSRKTQKLLAALALALAVVAPLWHSAPHHGPPTEPDGQTRPVDGLQLITADGDDAASGGVCPACLHQRLLNQSCVENLAAISAPASTTVRGSDSDDLPVSHRSMPPGARAPPTC